MVDVILLLFLIVIYVRLTENNEVIIRKFREIEDILEKLPRISTSIEEHSHAIKQGLSKFKEAGGKLGPPIKLTADTKTEVLKRYALGFSMREISEQMNLSIGSVHKAIKQTRMNDSTAL
jgi:DNA-binding NarL/FixJ family response regulator